MEFTPVNQLQISITPEPTNATQLSKILQLGQIVSATVVSPTTAQGQSLVTINGELLNVLADKLLAAGDKLDLKVTQLPTLPFAKALNVPIQQVSQAQVSLLMSAPEPVLKTWQAGTILQAVILDQKPGGQTLLEIGGKLIQADAAQLFRRGQPIALQINNLTNPIVARIVAEAAPLLTTNGGKTPHSNAGQQADPVAARVGLNMAITPGLRLQLAAPLLNQLQAGQQLDTSVTSATHSGKAVLNINGMQVNVQTSLPLTRGQQLSLQIIDLGKPAILIPVDSVKPENITTQIQDTMRQLLPQQSGLTELLGSVTQLAQPASQMTSTIDRVNPTVGEQLRFLARQILQQLPRASEASTASGIKSALRQSGVYLENQLASSISQQNSSQQAPPANDLKANLLRLLAFLQRELPSASPQAASQNKTNVSSNTAEATRLLQPPLRYSQPQAQARSVATSMQLQNSQALLNELLRQVTGSLARIQLHQLASIGMEEEPHLSQITEIPIHHQQGADVFHIRIEEDRTQKQKARRDKTWSVTLAFDIGKFGPIHVKLSLIKEVINTTFWAEQAATKQIIDSQLDILHKNYVKAGLGIGHMICHLGAPPQTVTRGAQATCIVDVQA